MSNRIIITGAVVAFSCVGCMSLLGPKRTPLADAQVAQLTTCKTGDLAQIKKNLVLAGYSVTRADGDIVETDYKQVSQGYGSMKELEKISVVKVDDSTTKFKVKIRMDGKEKVETGEIKDGNGRTIATNSRMENKSEESDEMYYEEARAQHEAKRKTVCGGT